MNKSILKTLIVALTINAMPATAHNMDFFTVQGTRGDMNGVWTVTAKDSPYRNTAFLKAIALGLCNSEKCVYAQFRPEDLDQRLQEAKKLAQSENIQNPAVFVVIPDSRYAHVSNEVKETFPASNLITAHYDHDEVQRVADTDNGHLPDLVEITIGKEGVKFEIPTTHQTFGLGENMKFEPTVSM